MMRRMRSPDIHVLPDPAAVAHDAARRVVEAARQAIAARGTFALALAGGSTPKALYELLAEEPFRSRIEWNRTEVYFGDERCVPPESSESNFRMANQALLLEVPIPGDNIFRMHGEDDPNAAAVAYGRMLRDRFGDGGFDLCLLGMGDDGHTASLFPHTAALDETQHRCVANHVEKLRSWRLTLTAPFLNRSGEALVMVCGAAKAERVRDVLEGERDPRRLPMQLIDPDPGRFTWLMDVAAAGMNED